MSTIVALYQRFKRQILSQTHLVRAFLLLAAAAGLVAIWTLILGPISGRAWLLWQGVNTGLPNSFGRTNFLILGREGASSTRGGGQLTDTMILVSVNHGERDTLILSIPRDLWVESLKTKVNAAYYYGEQKKPGEGGIILAKAAVSELIDQPIHFAVVIDFAGFEQIIDLMGGVDVDVQRGFIDHNFPIPGREEDECGGDLEFRCRYETVEFKPGLQHMDGTTALKFVRSRQAEGDEGSDFARSKRQEALLLAVRDKLLSRAVLTNFKLLRNLYGQLSEVVITDLGVDLYPSLAKMAMDVAKNPPRTETLSEPDHLYHPPISAAHNFQWVLLPTESLTSHIENLLTVPLHD